MEKNKSYSGWHSLGVKFSVYVIVLLIVLAIVLFVIFNRSTQNILRESLEQKAKQTTENLANSCSGYLFRAQHEDIRKLVIEFVKDADINFIFVFDEIGTLVAREAKSDIDGSYVRGLMEKLKLREKYLYQTFQVEAAQAVRESYTDSEDQIMYSSAIIYNPPGESQTGRTGVVRPRGAIVIGVTLDNITRNMQDIQRKVFFPTLFVLLLALVLSFILIRSSMKPVEAMATVAVKAAEGDLTHRVEVKSRNEIGVLADAFNKMTDNLRDMISKVKQTSKNVVGSSEKIREVSRQVTEGGNQQADSTQSASQLMEAMIDAMNRINNSVEHLSGSSEETSSSILSLGAAIDQVAANAESLSISVDDTFVSTEEMMVSIQQVASNVRMLFESMEITASSITEIDHSIQEVETHARESSDITERVVTEAEMGMKKVESTIEGMRRIRKAFTESEHAMGQLVGRSSEIGEIVTVIEDIAGQTNLLALNAAILAAQAGEHGKGFAVLAGEIRELAERTSSSTKEIAHLIKSVQQESKKAMDTIEEGSDFVEQGVHLSNEAGEVLKLITESAKKSTTMAKEIARATREQTKGSHNVTRSIENISKMIDQINTATQEQEKGSNLIVQSSEKMKVNTSQVAQAAVDQSKESKSITKSITSINELIQQILNATQVQASNSEQIKNAILNIREIIRTNTGIMESMENNVSNLITQAESLAKEVEAFKTN